MATDNHHDDAPAMDYAEHENTFALFAELMKWGTVFSVVFVLVIGAITALIPWSFALIVSALTTFAVAKFF